MSLPSFPKFDAHSDEQNAGIRWRKWLNRFEIFLQAQAITNEARKKAMLLHYSGEECFEIYDNFTEEERGGDTYAELKQSFTISHQRRTTHLKFFDFAKQYNSKTKRSMYFILV